MAEIPLYNRAGEVVAHALIDDADLPLVEGWNWSRIRSGYAVGKPVSHGYKREYCRGPKVGGKAKMEYMHRRLLGLEPGDGRQADHRNENKLDNRRSNLRVCDNSLNRQNQRGIRRTSIYRGVAWDKSNVRWQAYAHLNRHKHNLGFYRDEYEAAVAAATFRAHNMPFSADAADLREHGHVVVRPAA